MMLKQLMRSLSPSQDAEQSLLYHPFTLLLGEEGVINLTQDCLRELVLAGADTRRNRLLWRQQSLWSRQHWCGMYL